MPLDELSARDEGDAAPRRPWATLALVIALVAPMPLVILGVHRAVMDAFDAVLERGALEESRRRVESLAERLPDVGAIIGGEPLTAIQRDVLAEAVELGHLFSVQILAPDGEVAVLADPAGSYKPYTLMQDKPPDARAISAYRTGEASVAVRHGQGVPAYPLTIAEAYIPAETASDERFVAKIRFDKTAEARIYAQQLKPLAVLLPLICAGIYLLPALAFMWAQRRARRRDAEVRFLSRHDMLTGLMNRHEFHRRMKAAFTERRGDIGVAFLDVDRFKLINDDYGHEFGDAFLAHIAAQLVRAVRRGDLIGRMGGDEFVIVMEDVSAAAMAEITERILAATRRPFTHEGTTITGGVSIGWHIAGPKEGHAQATKAADLALYHAKTGGRGRAVQYFDGLDAALLRRRHVERVTREQLEAGGLGVVFQPLVASGDGTIVGFEALTRLTATDGETIPPTEFIPVAESTGMIHEIGLQTLRRAARAATAWPDRMFVSVNLSPAQFDRTDMADQVRTILEETGLPARRLELEVTESLLLSEEERVAHQLVALKELGVSIAMDDFGTGYSSLAYLWKYKFDRLKVDRVFLEAAAFGQGSGREIIETIAVLGRKMGMQVTVEGVETDAQRLLLSSLDCDHHQGFLYGKPMSAEEAAAAIRAGGTLEADAGARRSAG